MLRPEIDQTTPITVHARDPYGDQYLMNLQPDEYSFGTYGLTYRFQESPRETFLLNWYRIDYIFQLGTDADWKPDDELTHAPLPLTSLENQE